MGEEVLAPKIPCIENREIRGRVLGKLVGGGKVSQFAEMTTGIGPGTAEKNAKNFCSVAIHFVPRRTGHFIFFGAPNKMYGGEATQSEIGNFCSTDSLAAPGNVLGTRNRVAGPPILVFGRTRPGGKEWRKGASNPRYGRVTFGAIFRGNGT